MSFTRRSLLGAGLKRSHRKAARCGWWYPPALAAHSMC